MRRPPRLALLCAALFAVAPAIAQQYPQKPVRIVVGVPPGGATDIVARLVGQKMGEQMGQPVVIDNRGGAGGNIGAELVAKSAPDGYTLFLATIGTMTINPWLYKNMPFETLRDFAAISQLTSMPQVLVVHPSVPAKNVKELVVFARARPNELFYSSSGQGSAQHLSMALFCQMTGVQMTHVPYKGTAPSILDVVAGRIAVTVASVVSTRPMFTTGKLRALATVGNKRTPALPEYPTVAESGVPGFGVDQWYAVFLPGGTSKEIATKLQEAVAKTVLEPETRKAMLNQGMDSVGNTPAEFTAIYNAEIARWAKVVKTLGLQAN